MQKFILFLILAALLIATAVFGVLAWQSAGDAQISLLGWLAMAAGVFFTILLGGGLMGLVFYSSRHGHDDNQFTSDSAPKSPPDPED